MKLKYWIIAARLRTLPLAMSCILMGAALAQINNYQVKISTLLLAFTTTIFLQILSNFANDYGDGIKGTDRNRLKKDRMVESNAITANQMLVAIVSTSIITFLIGLILLVNVFGIKKLYEFLFFLIIGITAIIASIKYTVGKNAYGYSGLGDLFVFVFFGLVGVIGSYYLFTNTFDFITLFGALFTGSLSCGVLNMNNMRDYKNDILSKKITVVVSIGINAAKKYHYILICSSLIAILTIIYFSFNLLLLLSIIPFFFLVKHLIFISKKQNLNDLDGQLKLISMSCFSSCFLLYLLSCVT